MFFGILLVLASLISASDGVPIQYSVQGKGEPALVFIHCWSCDRHLWDAQVPVFSRDHKVVTIDLPGHGLSGKKRKQWSIAGFGDDVRRVVAKLGLKKVILIGSSMGGPVALEAALLMPDRVVGIVPVDILHDFEAKTSREEIDGMVQQMRADYKGQTTKFMTEYLFAAETPARVKERLIAQATARPPEISIRVLDAAMAYDPLPTLRQLKVPIRAINSALFPTNLAANRKYHAQFDAVIMKRVGHYPMMEDPERFNELLRAILRDFESKLVRLPALRDELLRMEAEDQRFRSQIEAEMLKMSSTGSTTPSEEYIVAVRRQEEIDSKNIVRLDEIIRQQGWPTYSLVGRDGAKAAFLILQHADLTYQRKYLPLLKGAAKLGEALPADAAMLEDRVLVGLGKSQIYGTQLHFGPETGGKLVLRPISDEKNVDKRRAAVGMMPLAEYLKHFGLEYKAPAK